MEKLENYNSLVRRSDCEKIKMGGNMEMTPEQTEMMEGKVNEACICKGCPSYEDCAEDKGKIAFCFPTIGKSKCIVQEKGCICGSCPVQKGETTGIALTHAYYCTRGSEKDQM